MKQERDEDKPERKNRQGVLAKSTQRTTRSDRKRKAEGRDEVEPTKKAKKQNEANYEKTNEGRPIIKDKDSQKTPEDNGISENNGTPEDNVLSISQKRKQAHFEKKKFRNPAADFIAQCNVLYNILSNSKCSSTEERQHKVQECINFIDGFDIQSTEAFVGKARLLSVSRCLQMCYKLGSPGQKRFMTVKLASEFVRMACTPVGLHLAQKMLTYSESDIRKSLIKKLIQHSDLDLFYSKFGSSVIAFALAMTEATTFRKQLLSKLAIPTLILVQIPSVDGMAPLAVYKKCDSRGKQQIKDHLEKVMSRCVDKELVDRTYFHEVFEFYVSLATLEELQSLLKLVNTCLPLFLSTRSGCVTICRLLDVADAKSRKKFIQSCRDASMAPIDIAFNSTSCIVLLKLLTCVDDTKLLKESILSLLFQFDVRRELPKEKEDGTALLKMIVNKTARKVLMLVLSDNCKKYFSEEETRVIKTTASSTSKKDPEVRRQELLDFVSKVFRWVILHPVDVQEFVETWIKQREAKDVFVEYLNKTKDVDVVDKLCVALKQLNRDKRILELFDHQTGQRTLVNLLRIGASFNPKSGDYENDNRLMDGQQKKDLLKNSDGLTLHEVLWEIITHSGIVSEVLQTRGVFVLIDLYTIIKSLQLKSPHDVKVFSKSCLSSLREISSPGTAGLNILKSRLSEV